MTDQVAVTGATGRIGTPLLDALVEAGHQVRALSRRPQPARPRVEWIVGDLLDPVAIARLVQGCGTVYHAAGELAGTPAAVERSLVDGTAAMLHATRNARLVHVSSLVVLETASPTDRPIDEASPLEPSASRRGAYTRGKAAAEALARDAARNQDVVIVRPGLVVDSTTTTPPAAIGVRAGPLLIYVGAGDALLPVVHATDVASGLLTAAATMQSGEVLHLIDPLPVTRSGFSRRIHGGKHPGIAAGSAMLVMARRFSRRDGRIGDASYRLLSAGTAHRWSSDRALRVGWQPRALATWYAATD